MERRGWTVLIGTVLIAALTAASLLIQVPYVAFGPGPTYNTLGKNDNKLIITPVKGTAYPSTGQLRMVTVSVYPAAEDTSMTLWEAVYDWWDPNYAVVPKEVVYPPDETTQQSNKRETQEMTDSQSAAEAAGYSALGCSINVTVTSVTKGGPSAGKLKAGDVITSVDGKTVTSSSTLVSLVQAAKPGTVRTVGYERNGKAGTTRITTTKDSSGKAILGVSIDEKQPCKYQVKVNLADVGGPSAGLMFALAIVDTFTKEDLTGGKVIAGTGTIDELGKVGAIGGIQEKMIGAKRDGATVFLTPADNCSEAKAAAPKGLRLIKVSTLHGALQALANLRAGRSTPTC